jgi:alkanesulfonate monooxygenase SsuD/methylene tetrahydromethanopterin reductase-like flavin-dependent oxidoreductase (luciferase family)
VRIGLITPLHGRPDGPETPSWDSIRAKALAAEAVGFDSFVFEDALLYRGETSTDGCWESFSIAAALAEATDRITIGQSVVNSPYRSPALTAKIAETIDEISGGRFVLGIGAGNTADSDYEAFGFPVDSRYSRFAEAIEIIHALLKGGEADFRGKYWSATEAELVLRGPRPQGPPVNIAAGGPKMLRLAARFGDGWNWWGYDETLDEISERMTPIIEELSAACREIGRDPANLERTIDVYTVIPPGMSSEGSGLSNPVAGTPGEIAAYLSGLERLGFAEVRCDLHPKTVDAVEAMQPVVELVHAI